MPAVADSSVSIHLAAIAQFDLLRQFYTLSVQLPWSLDKSIAAPAARRAIQ